MSADNGIYVLKLKDQYRVIHAQAIENLYYSHTSNNFNHDCISTRLVEYYGDCRYTRNLEMALNIAEAMNRRWYTEYGVRIISVNKTWKQIEREAKELAKLELETLKKEEETSWSKYQISKLENILAK